jgi:uncharacterized protein
MAEQTKAPPQAGTFCWNEVMTRNLPAAKTFYTKLFGWTTEEMNMGPAGTYTIWKQGETSVGGMMQIPQRPDTANSPPHWLAYVSVDSVDAATKKAQTLGAKVHVPPTDIPNIGRFSIITDPTGASLGLYQSA